MLGWRISAQPEPTTFVQIAANCRSTASMEFLLPDHAKLFRALVGRNMLTAVVLQGQIILSLGFWNCKDSTSKYKCSRSFDKLQKEQLQLIVYWELICSTCMASSCSPAADHDWTLQPSSYSMKWDHLAYQCPTQLVIEHSSVLNILLWPRWRFLKKLPCESSFFPVSLRGTWKQMIMVLRIMHSRHWKDIVQHNFIFTLFCMKLIWSWIPQVPCFLKLTVTSAQAYIPSFCKFSVYSFLDSNTLEDTKMLEYCEILSVFWNIYYADSSATFFVLGGFFAASSPVLFSNLFAIFTFVLCLWVWSQLPISQFATEIYSQV